MTQETHTKKLTGEPTFESHQPAASVGRAPVLAPPQQTIPEERIPEGGLAGIRAKQASDNRPLVKAVALTKRYLGTLALNDVSLTLRAGEIFGLVGPNGAGKTTLLRILATLTPPDSGEVEICGFPISKVREVRARIGFMPDVLGVYDDMLVREYLEFFARAAQLPEATRAFAIEETMKAVGIAHSADQPVDGLSRGNKQRLCLGRAILHKPQLLLLDEPASGLDPLARLELREILRSLQRAGATVVISSHVLEDLEDMCDRIGVVANGRMICVEDTRQLIQDRGGRLMRMTTMGRSEELYDYLKKLEPRVQGVRWDNESVMCRVEGSDDADLAQILRSIVEQGIQLIGFQEEVPTLETAYMNVTKAG